MGLLGAVFGASWAVMEHWKPSPHCSLLSTRSGCPESLACFFFSSISMLAVGDDSSGVSSLPDAPCPQVEVEDEEGDEEEHKELQS